MGYFKRKREEAETRRMNAMIDLFKTSTIGTYKAVNQGVTDAINIFDSKKYEYERNFRINLMSHIEGDGDKANKLIDEVAEVINEKMEIYSIRISKKNRECLAMDILNSLAAEKK